MRFFLQNPHHAMVAHVELQIPGDRFYRVEIDPLSQITCPHDLSEEEWRIVETQLIEQGGRPVDSIEACFIQFGKGSANPKKLADQTLTALQAEADRHAKLVEDEKKKYPKKKGPSGEQDEIEVTPVKG